MHHLSKSVVLLAVCSLFGISVTAQNPHGVSYSRERAMTVRQQSPVRHHGMEALAKFKPVKSSEITTFTRTERPPLRMAAPKASPLYAAADGTELWGVVVRDNSFTTYNTPYAVKSFYAKSPLELTTLKQYYSFNANGGGTFYDGALHFLSLSDSWWGQTVEYYAYNTEDWSEQAYQEVSDNGLLATDVSYNPTDGKVYGCFYKSDLSTRKWDIGTIDYDTQTKTVLFETDTCYMAIAVNKNGEMYGLSRGGYLYKIGKTLADTHRIGATGIGASDYAQSAAFDLRRGTLYLAGISSTGASALYVLDTTTGAASKIADFPNGEQVTCLYVPAPAAEDGAPAAILDLTASFPNGSLTGTVDFTAPSETFIGGELSGNLTYYVVSDGDTLATGTCAAGSKVSAPVTVKGGQTEFVVTTANAVGSSPKAKTSLWVGPDQPQSIEDVILSVDPETREATLTWTRPTAKNGGFIDYDSVMYIIGRYPDEKIDTITGDTVYKEIIPEGQMKSYYYTVAPVYKGNAARYSTSNAVVVGDAFTPPYYESFSQDGFNLYTTIDGDGDGRTWQYNYAQMANSAWAYAKEDDWLITPPIKLEADKTYALSFKIRSSSDDVRGTFEVLAGKGTDPTKYDVQVIDKMQPQSSDMQIVSGLITPSDNGEYHFGIHDISDNTHERLLIDDLALEELSSVAPDSISNWVVTPDNKGGHFVKMTFDAPTKTADGKKDIDADADLKAVVSVDNQPVDTVSMKPGEAVSLDNVPCNEVGYNEYRVTTYIGSYKGFETLRRVWVGQDTPMPPTDIKMADNETSIHVNWKAPGDNGVYGGYVDPATLKYEINIVNGDELQILDTVSTVEFNDPILTDTGTQKIQYYLLRSIGEGGKSEYAYPASEDMFIVGKPHELPFTEPVASGLSHPEWWAYGYTSAFTVSSSSSNGDGYCMAWSSAGENDKTWLNSGKLNIKNVDRPTLVFSYYLPTDKQASVEVLVKDPSQKATSIETFRSSEIDKAGWYTAAIDLSEFKSQRYITLQFAASGDANAVVGLDDINVYDMKGNDAAALSLLAPAKAKAGTVTGFDVKVRNMGENALDKVGVSLYAGGKKIATSETGRLESLADTTLTISCRIPVNVKDSLAFYAVTELDGDEALANDTTASSVIAVTPSDLKTVNNLGATAGGGQVVLTWKAPELANADPVTDGFEDYSHSQISNIGQWTTIDRDGGRCYGISNVSYDHKGEAFAFMVFNPDEAGAINSGSWNFDPHEGDQYLMHLSSSPSQAPNGDDDRLISPELSGDAQTVSFWARRFDATANESFELLYSTTDNDPASFVKDTTYTNIPTSWTEYELPLPFGAKYFAIHVTSKDAYALFFDDVTYTPKSSNILAYNIYRDGELIGSVAGDVTTYTDKVSDHDAHVYNVSVLYPEGESPFSVVSVSITDAIEFIRSLQGQTFDVYSVGGALLKSGATDLRGLPAGVYVINDHKVLVK